ncbi:MFS general substrate transporter [Obba rivulosa]|uniref:MFS general substrate transporter n=1 Tax=Obba rivulosa TaxID=1052685 RepID=A0A8E2AM69_9APHY|nr:MFS general substrate transporter [Obba rivulosa]
MSAPQPSTLSSTARRGADDGGPLGDVMRASRVTFAVDKPPIYALGSALDVDTASASSLDIPSTATSDRIRRRSDVARIRPRELTAPEPEAIELPVLNYFGKHEDPVSISLRTAGPSYASDPFVDPEQAQGTSSFPSSHAPSVHAPSVVTGEEAGSTAPVVSAAQKAEYKRKSRMHFAALCYSFWLEGWNDGTTGPLLPTIQRHYDIGFAIVSLLFVMNCIGFLSGSLLNVHLNDRYGFGKVLVLGAVLQVFGYALISPAGPFPLMCIGFLFTGFGIALQNAQANGFVGSLKEGARTKFGFLHATYGLGALTAPLVATQFVGITHWSFHYLISTVIGVTNVAVLYFVFKGKNQDDVMAEAGAEAEEASALRENKYRQILGLKEVHYLSTFALIYVGVEVSLGGWIVTFIEQKRGGGASAGYISSGFFGGLMLGRILLMWLNRKIGERRIMFIYALLAIQLEVTIWVVPSLIENAVAVSFIGLLLGPMYPILMTHSTAILPRRLLTGCVGYIGGLGQAGSAVLPFITGLLASKFGIESLQPLIVSMMSTMIVIWALVPRVRRVD